MEPTEVRIPKWWRDAIAVPHGPLEGRLAQPCACGSPTNLDEGDLYLVQWSDGSLMFIHEECRRLDAEV